MPSTSYATVATPENPLPLGIGTPRESVLEHATLAYETLGTLNADRSNAILVCHALTGSHHVAGADPIGPTATYPGLARFWTADVATGWWDKFIGEGPQYAIDTRDYYVICANYLGSCYGSTGPWSADPNDPDGRPYGARFPWPTIADITETHARLLDELGINRLHAIAGGSVGGFLAQDFALRHPHRVARVLPLASGMRASNATKVANYQQIYAIEADAKFRGGDYPIDDPPVDGLRVARMIGHAAFVSLDHLGERAAGTIRQPEGSLASYRMQDPLESYIHYHASKFVRRFDPNSYLRILHMWQQYDLARDASAAGYPTVAAYLADRAKGQRWLVMSIDSDHCFFPAEQAALVQELRAAEVPVRYSTVHSEKGHDSFLLDDELFAPPMRSILETEVPR